ncbi:MAG: ABC transporter permease [Thermodesulfobacteriota bacterium]
MILRANLSEAVRSLASAKQRTLLALLGIVIGIGSVIAMVSIGAIVQDQVLRQFRDMGTDILTVAPEAVYAGSPAQEPFRVEDVWGMADYCPDVEAAAPYKTIHGDLEFEGRSAGAPALGVTGGFRAINKLIVVRGRFIHDLDAGSWYCVLGERVADKMAEAGVRDPIGEKIRFNGKEFTVIGTLAEAPMGGLRPYEINDGILIPLALCLRMAGSPGVDSVLVKLAGGAPWQETAERIRQYFQVFKAGAGARVASAEELVNQMQKQLGMLTLLLGVIGGISLVVGGIGVMNVMLVSVSERKAEIGIRRALGARKADIRWQFLIESLTLCILGGVLGIGLGVLASYIAARVNGWQFLVSLPALVLGVGVSFAAGVFFGYYPARQAADLNPIEALKL